MNKNSTIKNKQNLSLRFRQIHMDYHTSGDIAGVGEQFDAKSFAKTLSDAYVDSVTCFARCHHGYMYYDTKLFPERLHPTLSNKNMLKEQVDACHKKNIRVCVYTTVMWDHYTSLNVPDWVCIDWRGNQVAWNGLHDPGFYRFLCLNSPYRDFLKEHIREVLEDIDADGIFLDIVWDTECHCRHCRDKMREKGIDIYNRASVEAFSKETTKDFTRDIGEFIGSLKPDASVYFNNGEVGPDNLGATDGFTHLEFDALPSGYENGYRAFPIRTRFERTLGLDCVGQTARFHNCWGDFHSYKAQEAMEYECFQLLSLGAKCMIGDQMMPSGKLDLTAYETIGAVYSQVKEKEPWCKNTKPVTELAVLAPYKGLSSDSMFGVCEMLTEEAFQYDIIDKHEDFSKYKLIILPDYIYFDEMLKNKIEKYLKNGGKILSTFESGLSSSQSADMPEYFGVDVSSEQMLARDGMPARGRTVGRNECADYILPNGDIGKNLPNTEHVMYYKGLKAEPLKNAKEQMPLIAPLFYRTAEHFCSHFQAPSSGKRESAAVITTENTIYFAHPLFSMFRKYGAPWLKTLAVNAIDLLLGKRIVTHNGPNTLEVAVNQDTDTGALILHALHYVPIAKATATDIVDTIIPLTNTSFKLRTENKPKTIFLVPQKSEISFKWKGGVTEFDIELIKGHQMVEISF